MTTTTTPTDPQLPTRASWRNRHLLPLLPTLIAIAFALSLFGSLSADVVEGEVFFFDRPLLLLLHAHATPWWDAVMIFFTRAGSAMVMVPFNLLVLIILVVRHRRRLVLFWFTAVGGAALLNLLAKHIFGRVRPDLWLSILPESTFSFPSGHAMQSMAVAGALAVLAWPTRGRWLALATAIVFVALVGTSRIYLGVHFPSDILAGWTASLTWILVLRSVLSVGGRAAATLPS